MWACMCRTPVMGPAWRLCWVAATLVVAVCGTATQQVEDDPANLRDPRQTDGLPLPVPVRHEEPVEGVPVGTAANPQCPPARPFSRELCGAPACLHHHRCPTGRACCFNGCVHTCLLTVASPPVHSPGWIRLSGGIPSQVGKDAADWLDSSLTHGVIDWFEDTSSHLPVLDESPQPGLPVRYEDPAFAQAREEMVHLPGGCTLSGKQYAELQTFMEAPSIEKCMCEKGEVVCSVKMFQS